VCASAKAAAVLLSVSVGPCVRGSIKQAFAASPARGGGSGRQQCCRSPAGEARQQVPVSTVRWPAARQGCQRRPTVRTSTEEYTSVPCQESEAGGCQQRSRQKQRAAAARRVQHAHEATRRGQGRQEAEKHTAEERKVKSHDSRSVK